MPIKRPVKKVARPPHKAPAKAAEQPEGKKKGGKPGSFDDTNRGVLFTNDKDGNDRRPDYTGKATIQIGKEKRVFRISAWSKESQSGTSFLSLNFQEPDPSYKSKPKGGDKEEEAETEE